MKRRRLGWIFGVAVLSLSACSRPGWLRVPDMPDMPDISMPSITLPSISGDGDDEAGRVSEVEVVESGDVEDFYLRATEFYERLEGRRFNSLVAFRDAGLRAYFENEQTFTDYYADVADDLATAHFARSVPIETEVKEFLVDGPGRARVHVKVVGDDGRPLRFWTTSIDREDRWERRSGQWWIMAGKP
jgi:hypothetical protein